MLPLGSSVTVRGLLTVPLGSLESGRAGFIEDDLAGIGLYLDAVVAGDWPAGSAVVASGVVDERFGQRTLRVAESSLVLEGDAALPVPLAAATGAAGESLEGRRIVVAGTTVGSPSALADGTGLYVDDGTGPVRVIVSADALNGSAVPAGTVVRAAGPLGQRDSSGTGTAGYRLHAVLPGDFTIVPTPPPTPSPTPTATPSPAPTPPPSPTPTPTPPTSTPSPTPVPPTPDPAVTPIAVARTLAVGTSVTVRGVVTAEPGRLGSPPLFAIQDGAAGIVVKLPDGARSPSRGEFIEVTGLLADPYGQLELRPAVAGVRLIGRAESPPVLAIGAPELGEGVEGRLVATSGRIDAKPRKATSGDLTIDLLGDDGPVRLLADASSGLTVESFSLGASYEVTGVAGQRASRKGALDGYRIWIRDPSDLRPLPAGENGAAIEAGRGSVVTIAAALADTGAPVTIEGVVTVGPTLLDSSGRRIVVEDGTGAIEVLAATDAVVPGRATRVRITGTVGQAYGAPRLKATAMIIIGAAADPQPALLRRSPGSAEEWRLVRVAGPIVDVRRLGDRWLAEIEVGGTRVPIVGLPGAGIAATSIIEGRSATITGIVRRPYPSAADRRFAITPRDPGDVAIGPSGSAGAGSVNAGTGATGLGSGPAGTAAGERATPDPWVDVDLGLLGEHVGRIVRVGGLVVTLTDDGFTLDDGTAIGRVLLLDEAAAHLPHLRVGDALNAIGSVELRNGEAVVTVRSAAGLLRVGDLGEVVSVVPSSTPTEPATVRDGARLTGLDTVLGGEALGVTGVLSLILASLASVAVGLVRRAQSRRRVAARIAARLESLARSPNGLSVTPEP